MTTTAPATWRPCARLRGAARRSVGDTGHRDHHRGRGARARSLCRPWPLRAPSGRRSCPGFPCGVPLPPHLPTGGRPGPRDPEQQLMDACGHQTGIERRMLAAASRFTLSAAVDLIHLHGGIAVAAHMDRKSFSVISQLGFMPSDVAFDGLEISAAGGRADGPRSSPFSTCRSSAFRRAFPGGHRHRRDRAGGGGARAAGDLPGASRDRRKEVPDCVRSPCTCWT